MKYVFKIDHFFKIDQRFKAWNAYIKGLVNIMPALK